MRTTIELPDELLTRAKSRAALEGLSLKEFFVAAVEQKLLPPTTKVRRDPPTIGRLEGPKINPTPEEVDAAAFG